jgi:(1->4)-alpha-D-glucan 1-alpha-D-glucosylmutase
VYRSYVSQESVEAADPSYLRQGLRRAETGAPHLQPEFDCLSRMIGAALQVDGEAFSRRARQCVQRLQQLSGPLMAKGFEDTYLYRNARLVSLNEVGGHPDRFGISLGAFHAFLKERALHWSSSLNASATHDTKRGEDVRARLNALSELPEDWARAVRRFAEINRPAKATLRGRPAPDGADEYFLYQTLIGAWPLDPSHYAELRGRIRDYTVKAVREAKLHSSWLDPDPAYEEACLDFIERLLPETGHNAFLETFLPLQRRIAHYGMINSLAQTAIKLTAPGLPDIYQGCELWDLSLVDPDNRRPVDFALRSRLLAGIRDAFARDPEQLLRDLLAHPKDGRVKLHLVHRALQLRQKRQALFAHGEYLPVQCRGMHRDRLVAFARRNGGQWSLTLVPRFTAPLLEQGRFPMGPDFWHDTSLVLPREAPRAWSSSLDGRRIELQDRELAVGQALEHFPVGILESAS